MSEEKKETRIKIEDLPQEEKELSAEEAKEVKGGLLVTTSPIDANVAAGVGIDTKAGAEGLAVNKAASAGQE